MPAPRAGGGLPAPRRSSKRVGSALRIAAGLAWASPLPWRARLAYLRLKLALALGRTPRAAAVLLDLGKGTVALGPGSLARELWTLEEIFLRGAPYLTEYRGAAVVDVGAHKGLFGAYAVLRGAPLVTSFEPASENFGALERCAESFRAKGQRWLTTRAAVGATAGRSELALSAETLGNSLLPLPEGGHRRAVGSEAVDVTTLGEILRTLPEEGGDRAIVKIDAEGAECEILASVAPGEWDRVAVVFVEHHPFAPCSRDEVVARLGEAGFRPDTRRGGSDEVLRFSRVGPG